MLSLSKKWVSIVLAVILMLGMASLTYAYTWSPDLIVFDGQDCANHPLCSPGYGQNGWDIDQVAVHYDSVADKLYVNVSMHNGVIAGDPDNNGDPGDTAVCLGNSGGVDRPDLGGYPYSGEAIDFVFDPDNDGTYEYIAGVSHSTNIGGITVANYTGPSPPTSYPGDGFGTSVGTCTVINNPNATNPDFEFTIDNFSSLRTPGAGENMWDFSFWVRAGSQEDAGTGEDTVAYGWIPTAVTVSSLTGRSITGSLASGLWLGLAGLTLVVGSLFWMKRRAS